MSHGVACDAGDLSGGAVARIGDGHQRRGVDAGIGVAPVCLEALPVSGDGLAQMAARLDLASCFARLVPAVLVDAAKQAAGLARRAAFLDHLHQDRFGFAVPAEAIERHRPLLAHQHGALQRAVEPAAKIDHALPLRQRAIGEQQVDRDAGLDRVDVAEPVAHRVERRDAARARVGELLFQHFGIGDLGAKDVGLQPVDRRRLVALEQLKQRRVHRAMAARLDQPLGQRLGCARRVGRRPVVAERIGQRAQGADVEGQGRAERHGQHGRLWPRRMADAELVIDVGVEDGEIGDGEFAEQDALVHQLVDEAGAFLLVGAHDGETSRLDRRGDHHGVDAVEIDHPPARIGLAAERHDDEADGAMVHGFAPGGSRS